MGVTHKLKKEVIDYIVALKNDNPKLGCRKLAEITSAKFDTKISKSSVNTILKSSNLSSSVGRPSKKFQIPSAKKQQISSELHKIPIPQGDTNQLDINAPESNAESDIVHLEAQDKATILKTSNQEDEIFEQNRGEDSSFNERVEQIELDNKNTQSDTRTSFKLDKSAAFDLTDSGDGHKVDKQFYLEKAGLIFLKAAIWENFRQDMVGGLLQNYRANIDKSSFDKICNTMLTMYALGIQDIDQIDEGSRTFLDIYDDVNLVNCKFDLFDKYSQESDQGLEAKTEIEVLQLYSQASSIKIALSNGFFVEVDAGMSLIEPTSTNISPQMPIHLTVNHLSTYIIENRKPLVLLKPQQLLEEDKNIYSLYAAFDSLKGLNIQEIEILNADKESIAVYPIIPAKKRCLGIGFGPNHPEFQALTANTHWVSKSSYFDEDYSQKFFYTVTNTDFLSKKDLKGDQPPSVLTIWEDENDGPVGAILSNCDANGNCKSILKSYLRKKNCIDRAVSDGQYQTLQREHNGEHYDPRDSKNSEFVFNKVNSFIEDYIKWQYRRLSGSTWNEKSLFSDIYNISGNACQKRGEWSIELLPTENAETNLKAKHLLKWVNCQSIQDGHGRVVQLRASF